LEGQILSFTEENMQVPTYGIFENISSMAELRAMPQWSAQRPLRIVTGYIHV
jgi:ATP phosphoribosyltransferase